MIFWDQFKDKIEDDNENQKSSPDSEKEPEKKEEVKEASPPISAAAPEVEEASDAVESTAVAVAEPAVEESAVPPATDAPPPPEPEKPVGKIKSFLSKKSEQSKKSEKTGKDPAKPGGKKAQTWYEDTFESVITQRNLMFLFMVVCVVTIALSVLLIRYVKNTQTIEPFVIEIERHSGIPTVVTPVDTRVYSSDEAVKRYFIMKYIRAREEYFPSTFQDNFFNVVRVLSASGVYFSDYRPKFSISNPNSPYNIYGENTTRRVVLKSLIFQSPNTAQVRIGFEVNGIVNLRQSKIVLIDFNFSNIEMNEDERFINPLGFQVTFYRIEDETS